MRYALFHALWPRPRAPLQVLLPKQLRHIENKRDLPGAEDGGSSHKVNFLETAAQVFCNNFLFPENIINDKASSPSPSLEDSKHGSSTVR